MPQLPRPPTTGHRDPTEARPDSGIRPAHHATHVAASLLTLTLLIACGQTAVAEPRTEVAQAATRKAAAAEKAQSAAKTEAAYVARLDKIVAPLQDYQLPDSDNTNLKAAFKALAAGELTKAPT